MSDTAIAMSRGKLRNIKKLNITLRLSINIKKYNLLVVTRLRIASFDDAATEGNTFLFSTTIKYLE